MFVSYRTFLITMLIIQPILSETKTKPQFTPKDSLNQLVPLKDPSSILQINHNILPPFGAYNKTPPLSKRLSGDCNFYLSGSNIIIKYYIEDKTISDTLNGYNQYLDTILTLLNSIPDGQYMKGTLDPSEIIIQSHKKYVSCVECLFLSNGDIVMKISKILDLLKTVQTKAYKK